MGVVTETHAAVLQQVAQVIKHGLLVLTADPAEVTQKAAAVGHHLRKCDFLKEKKQTIYSHITAILLFIIKFMNVTLF